MFEAETALPLSSPPRLDNHCLLLLAGRRYAGLARTVYIYTVNDRILGDFPAQNTVYTPYICGFGQPYKVSKEKAFSQEL